MKYEEPTESSWIPGARRQVVAVGSRPPYSSFEASVYARRSGDHRHIWANFSLLLELKGIKLTVSQPEVETHIPSGQRRNVLAPLP